MHPRAREKKIENRENDDLLHKCKTTITLYANVGNIAVLLKVWCKIVLCSWKYKRQVA